MNNHNKSPNGKPGDIDKQTIIQNIDIDKQTIIQNFGDMSMETPEEVNDLFGDHSSEEANSLSLDDLDFPTNSLDDAEDLSPFIEDNSNIMTSSKILKN